jgi:hypothetical protein
VYFREPSFEAVSQQLKGIFVWDWMPVYGVALQFLGAFVAMLFLIDIRLESSKSEYLFAEQGFGLRIAVGLAACILITLLGANESNAFIYFRF